MKDLLPKAYRRGVFFIGTTLVIGTLGIYQFARDRFEAWFFPIVWLWAFYICHLIVISFIVMRIHHPIKQLEKQLGRLREGVYDRHFVQQVVPIYNRLGRDLNLLGQSFSELEEKTRDQKTQIDLLLKHLSVGVLALDLRGRVTLASQSMQAYFPETSLLGESFIQISKTADLNRLVDEVYQNGVAINREIDFYWPQERTVDVSVSPVLQGNRMNQVLLLFYDVTHLRRLEQMRQDFVSNVSHELKTPVTSIKGFAETLLAGAKDDDKVRDQFLGIIYQESQRLQDIIRDVLYLARLEQVDSTLVEENLDLADLISELAQSLSGQLSEKDLHLECINCLTTSYIADKGRLSQVLLNLLANAIHYTDPGGQITVTLTQEESKLVIEVADTGIGIPERELERIFERFYRVNKGRSRQSGGTGLGLSIVKNLLTSMDGHIKVKSQVGQGSQFTIYLPRKIIEKEG